MYPPREIFSGFATDKRYYYIIDSTSRNANAKEPKQTYGTKIFNKKKKKTLYREHFHWIVDNRHLLSGCKIKYHCRQLDSGYYNF